MPATATLLLAFLAMLAFAANGLLCRAALGRTGIDPASFTAIRLVTGALSTWALVNLDRRPRREARNPPRAGTWASGLALFIYAAAFSFAYRTLPAATGALILFPAVQGTMVLGGLWRGERIGLGSVAGLALALAGLAVLLRPGLAAPPLAASTLMFAAGVAWGVYSLRGLGAPDPARATAGNFLRAALPALLLSLAWSSRMRLDPTGCALAAVSGALMSGLGYALWYRAMGGLTAATAAGVQLSVPVLTALGGVALLGEAFSLRMALSSAAILGGIALVLRARTVTARLAD